jgi:hypothetical protein
MKKHNTKGAGQPATASRIDDKNPEHWVPLEEIISSED